MTLFDRDIDAGKSLRDAAFARVRENGRLWLTYAIVVFPTLDLPEEFLGEDVADALREVLGEPHTPNAFGSLMSKLIEVGLITGTGRWATMRRPGSHARRSPVYRRVT